MGRGEAPAETHTDRSGISLRIVDGDDRPLDARIRLEPLGLADRIGSLVNGSRDLTAIAARGRLDLELEPGRYRLVASHGPEFELVARELDVRASRIVRVAFRLRRVVDAGDYLPADFHVHTDASDDGRVSLEHRIASLRAEGLAIAALTDHNRVTAPPPGQADDPFVVSGVEVTTWSPEVGHFNVFPAERALPHEGRTAQSVFDEAHRAATRLVQVNHPRLLDHIAYFGLAGLTRRGGMRPGFSMDFDLLEVWNGYDLGRPEAMWSVFREWLGLVDRGHRIVAMGNSDSHDVDRTWVGYPRTYVALEPVRIAVPSESGLVDALREGRAYVTTGPLLDVRIGDVGPGGTVTVPTEGTIEVRVRVMAAPHVDVDRVELWLGDRWVRSLRVRASGDPLRFDRTLRLDAKRARSLVVAVRGDTPMRDLLPGRAVLPAAFTNPIRLVRGDAVAEVRRAAGR